MKDLNLEKLQKLVEERERRENMGGGEIFAGWGVLNLLALATDYFVSCDTLVWIIMILVGITGQIIYLKIASARGKSMIFWEKAISNLWVFLVAILPVIFYLYPFVLKVYPNKAIFPLVMLWLSIGLFVSGIIVGQLRHKIGGFVFLAAAVLTPLLTEQAQVWVYAAAVVLGLIVPGLWKNKFLKKG